MKTYKAARPSPQPPDTTSCTSTTRPILRGALSLARSPSDPSSPSRPDRDADPHPHPSSHHQQQPAVPTSSTVAFTYRALYDDDDDDDLSASDFGWPLQTTRDWKIPTRPHPARLTRCPSTGSLVSIEVLQELLDRSGRSLGRSLRSGKGGGGSSSYSGSGGDASHRSRNGLNSSHRSFGEKNDDDDDDDREIGFAANGAGPWRLFPALFRRGSGRDDGRDSLSWNPFVKKKSVGNAPPLGEEKEGASNRRRRRRRRRNSTSSAPIRMGTEGTLHSYSSDSDSRSQSDKRDSLTHSFSKRSSSFSNSSCHSGTSSSTGSVNVTEGLDGLTTSVWYEERLKETNRKRRGRRRQKHYSAQCAKEADEIQNNSPNHDVLPNTNPNESTNDKDSANGKDSANPQDPLPKEVSSSSLKENEQQLDFHSGQTITQSRSDGEIAKPNHRAIHEGGHSGPKRRASDPTSPTLSIRTTISTMSRCPIHSDREESKLHSCGEERTIKLEEEMVKLAIDENNNMLHANHVCGDDRSSGVALSEEIQENTPQTDSINVSLVRKRSDGETTVPNHLPFPVGDNLDLNAYDILFDFDNIIKTDALEQDDQSSQSADSVRLSIRNDFEKASRRGSFQRSMSVSSGFCTSISSKSGDFADLNAALDASSKIESQPSNKQHSGTSHDHDALDPTTIPNDHPHPLAIPRESTSHPNHRSNTRIRRRPTEQSETTVPGSIISSLDSLASPIDRARACHAQLFRNQLTRTAVAAVPSLKRESSLGSMSSLGTESVARGLGRVFMRSLDNSVHRVDMDYANPKIEREQPSNDPIRSGKLEHDEKASVEKEARRPPQSYTEDEVRMNSDASIDYEDLVQSRNPRHFREQSSITLGTFFSELHNSFISGVDSSEDSNSIEPDKETCDLDSAVAAFAIATKLGHFGFLHDEVILNTNTEEDNDHFLAAKAFMGLGFAGQQKGEHERALESYMKSLQLWESEIGSDHPSLACLHYTIGTVLSQMRSDLEASVHFNNALSLLKSIKNNDERVRASILSTEGMIFSVLGEAGRGIDCFRKALLTYQNVDSPLDLSYSTIMHELGTLLAQQGDIQDAISCYKYALDIRETTLGNSFLVMQTHYSLGVTLAHDDSPSSQDYALIHLEKALGLCGGDHIQAPTILHAIGVLKEKKGDFHAAANWFYKELNTMKSLFGDDDERVGMCSSDVGSSFFQIGKYDLATVLFEQALRILLQVTENEPSLEVADLLYKIASCHESLCEYDEALGIFEEVKQVRQALTGIESSPVIKAMLRIGNVQLSRGEAQLALDCFNEIVGIGYASDSINGIEVANALYGRGCAQYCLFQLPDAMKSLNESLNWKLAALGEDDPGLACIFYQMAHVYLEQSEEEDATLCFEEYARLLKIDKQRNLQDNAEICHTTGIVSKLKGEYDKALAYYDQALAMFETLFANKQYHEKLATIHFDIGCIHAIQGNNKEALRQLQFCLAMRKKLFGAHVEVANVLYEMAVILQQEDMTKTAVMCLEESDSIWRTKLGCSDKLISVCHSSGKLWKALLRYEEAEGNLEKALELAITLHGRCHDTVATILLDLGELLHEICQYEQALFCYNESLDVRTQLFGPDDLSVASVLYCKGVALLFQGNFEEAYKCLNRSLMIRQKELGDVHNDVGDTLNTIGFLQLRSGNLAEDSALSPLTKALEVRRALGNKSKVVSTLQNLASLYKKRKEFDLCMEMHSEILAVRQEEFGTNDDKVAEAWINLGNIQTTAGRMVEATVSYEEALRIRTLSSGYNHKSVAHVLFKLGLLNSRQNNYNNAKQLFEEYIRLRAEEEDDPDQEMAQALTLVGDIQLDTGEKSKAQINWMSAMEIYLNLGYPEDHPKVVKLKLRQKTLPTFGLFAQRRMSSVDVSRVAGDLSSVVDAPLSLFSRLAGVPSDMPDSIDNNVCVNH